MKILFTPHFAAQVMVIPGALPVPDVNSLKTAGDLINLLNSDEGASKADAAAAIAADQKAASSAKVFADDQAVAATAFLATGPITVSNVDGTFTTYLASTSAPGYRIETSQGVTALLTPPPAPAPVTPTN